MRFTSKQPLGALIKGSQVLVPVPLIDIELTSILQDFFSSKGEIQGEDNVFDTTKSEGLILRIKAVGDTSIELSQGEGDSLVSIEYPLSEGEILEIYVDKDINLKPGDGSDKDDILLFVLR